MGSPWTLEQIIQGARDAATFLEGCTHPDALEWANACRLAAHELDMERAADEIERLRAALEVIAGRRQCLDNLMSNVAIAEAALAGTK